MSLLMLDVDRFKLVKIIAAADQKLYEAKEQGRNRCRHGVVQPGSPAGATVKN